MAAEHVMVMKRSSFQSAGDYLSPMMARETLQLAWPEAEWLSRQQAEKSERWVQIIPCAVIQDESGRYAVFRRSKEPRDDLSRKVSLLIGGHVESDFCKDDSLWTILLRSLLRELKEEVNVHNPSVDGLIGLLVDNNQLQPPAMWHWFTR